MKLLTIAFTLFFFIITETNAQTPTLLLEGNQIDGNYGWDVCNAGDINADGYDDIVVGAYTYDNGQSNEGAVFVYMGSATGLVATPAAILESNQAEANMGRSVSRAGDVNNDGYDDIVVGAWNYDTGIGNEGRVYIYHGSAAGLITTPAKIIDGNQNGGNLGSYVSTAGDVNNDGYDDVVAAAWLYETGQFDEGRVYVYLGSATGITTPAVATLDGNQNWAHFGTSVANAGDINADGYDDIVVGFELFDG
ncbi:MAG: FG-GAP repeat protein, partial [Chitinophagales bacterium]|nr:FG-GAP repeat protein [Chitinophagales bacterium]